MPLCGSRQSAPRSIDYSCIAYTMEIYSITTAVKRLVNTASFVILRKYERRKMPIFLKSPFTKFCRQIFYFVAIGANGDRQREPWCRCLVEGGVIWHCFVVVFAPHLDITYQEKINVYILHNYIIPKKLIHGETTYYSVSKFL